MINSSEDFDAVAVLYCVHFREPYGVFEAGQAKRSLGVVSSRVDQALVREREGVVSSTGRADPLRAPGLDLITISLFKHLLDWLSYVGIICVTMAALAFVVPAKRVETA